LEAFATIRNAWLMIEQPVGVKFFGSTDHCPGHYMGLIGGLMTANKGASIKSSADAKEDVANFLLVGKGNVFSVLFRKASR
jgi:hypothetical protein